MRVVIDEAGGGAVLRLADGARLGVVCQMTATKMIAGFGWVADEFELIAGDGLPVSVVSIKGKPIVSKSLVLFLEFVGKFSGKKKSRNDFNRLMLARLGAFSMGGQLAGAVMTELDIYSGISDLF